MGCFGGFGHDNSCLWIIILLIIVFCCCGNDNDCGRSRNAIGNDCCCDC